VFFHRSLNFAKFELFFTGVSTGVDLTGMLGGFKMRGHEIHLYKGFGSIDKIHLNDQFEIFKYLG